MSGSCQNAAFFFYYSTRKEGKVCFFGERDAYNNIPLKHYSAYDHPESKAWPLAALTPPHHTRKNNPLRSETHRLRGTDWRACCPQRIGHATPKGSLWRLSKVDRGEAWLTSGHHHAGERTAQDETDEPMQQKGKCGASSLTHPWFSYTSLSPSSHCRGPLNWGKR